MSYADDREWADKYTPQIRRIVKSLAGMIINIRIATDEEDVKIATDYQIITLDGTSIGCRLRKGINFFYDYNDITFRETRPSGVLTELDKIKAGNPKWYLYGWVDTNDKISHWVFIDMDKLRHSGLLENPDDRRSNRDRSSTFIGIRVTSLNKRKCLKRVSKPVDLFLKHEDQASLNKFSISYRVSA